jgi:alpha/beta superfamily hydrolase
VPTAPAGRAVVCHPHPLMGGTMENKVVTTCVRAAAACDLATLRFDFRGVGDSEGKYDDGRGEQLDVRAALRTADRLVPDGNRVLIGFSFGSVACCRLLSQKEPSDQVDQLIAVGLPLRTMAPPRPPLPAGGLMVVIGDRDTFVSVQAAREWVDGYRDLRSHATQAPDLRSHATQAPDLRSHATQAPDLRSHATQAPDLRSHATQAPDLRSHATQAPDLRSHATQAPDLRSHATQAPDLRSHATQAPNPPRPKTAVLGRRRLAGSRR